MRPVRPVIRTSDRIQFKKCRRAWDISSKLRQNLEPVILRPALDFGTAWHALMEVWDDPERHPWKLDDRKDVLKAVARLTLHESLNKQYEWIRRENPDGDEFTLREEFAELHALGDGMADYFFKWESAGNDVLTPVYVEIEFEVPIKWNPAELGPVPYGFNIDLDLNLYLADPADEGYGTQLFYQGRIDMIGMDREGRLWVIDHKTAKTLSDTTEYLELDEQMKSYVWGIRQMLGINVVGVCYSQHRKGFPQPPEVLSRPYKGRRLSTNKQQTTDLSLMLQAIKETGEPVELYEDYLHYLENEGLQFIRREWINYSENELENLGKQIALEAVDMLGNPSVYPAPDMFKCKWCDHRLLCLAMNDGSDTDYIKETYYRAR